jgi:hypothetical protein
MVVGPAIQLLVRTGDGQEVLVRQQRTGSEEPVAEGDRVILTWADGAALALEEQGGDRDE